MSTTARWSLLVAFEAMLVLFLLMFGTTLFADIVQHKIQLVILAVLGGIGWVVVLWRPDVLPPLLVVAPLPILASLAITSIASPYPSLSGNATWQSAAYVGIAWLVAIQARHPVGRRNLVAVMGIVATVVIGYFLIHVITSWRDWIGIGFPLLSVPLRPNYGGGLVLISAWLADVVVLSAPVVVASLWVRDARIHAIVLATVALGAIVLSGTRSVQLLIVAVAIVLAPMVIAARGDRRTKVLSGTALVVVAAVGISTVLQAGRAFDEGRSLLVASAVDQFVSSPIVGTGPGTYGVERMSHSTDSLVRLAQSDALNTPLTTASDSGIVGLVGLALSAAAYAVASRRAWMRTAAGRPVILAAVLGIIVFAGHSLGEFVFGLIGTVLLLIAAVSIAATDDGPDQRVGGPRPRWLTAGLVAGIVVIAASSVVVVRNEMTRGGVSAADSMLQTTPGTALAAARGATGISPDSVPAWWVRMVAADAAGDPSDSIAAARRIVELEGFSQEWLSLGILLSRAGEATGARVAMDQAVASPTRDPIVELNAAEFYDRIGATDEAKAAMVSLLQAQPDIQPILADGMPELAELAASARGEAAADAMGSGDMATAFLNALYGEDRPLAAALLERVAVQDLAAAATWRTIVDAWFGDGAARATHDANTLAHPAPFPITWSWRLAVRACDPSAADRWERAYKILAREQLATPTSIGSSPAFQVPSLPARYPQIVWGIDHPQRPYVSGILTYGLGRPPCAQP